MQSLPPSKQFEALRKSIKSGSTPQSNRALRLADGLDRKQHRLERQGAAEMEFRTRSVEAFFGCVMTGFGLIFMIPGDTLARPGWEFVREYVSIFPGTETRLGFILALVGLIRLVALYINGSWYPTPVARFIGCVVGSLFWMSCTVSFLGAPSADAGVPSALAWVFSAVAFEWFSATRAVADMHVMDSLGFRAKAMRDGRDY